MEIPLSPIELGIFASRLEAVCDEMGAVLRNAAFSPNIRDRLDFSCAVFDHAGGLCAQAAHIPVHLGSMAFAMASVVAARQWEEGDLVILNDPFLGGTHLPDVTVIAPLFADGGLLAFVVNRAHHADIGASAPGSMPLSRSLHEEGQIIAPVHLIRRGVLDEPLLASIVENTRNPADAKGDFYAQISADRAGLARLGELVARYGVGVFRNYLTALNDYGERLARGALRTIPEGTYDFEDRMDDDGQGHQDLPIRVRLRLRDAAAQVDFTGTAEQAPGNINCPLAVTAAAVLYVFRCLMPPQTPACAGSFRPVRLSAPEGCLLNARYPAAVAAGNVETSSRIVDVVMGALAQAIPERIPAASHGGMNNLAMGSAAADAPWDYYETIGGGMGAGAVGGGRSGLQTHMTNTLNTPIEVLESRFPLRILTYGLRRGSGGRGRRAGGDGLVRELEFLSPAEVSLLTERRRHAPWGAGGGAPGQPGRNLLNGRALPGKIALAVTAGDRLRIETPGGGGWGRAAPEPKTG
ncbi:MAG: hydantoinase B/oxoprolinase family protein [Candidatus Thiosymbion ectosymbiont of Robbea hypermnestra]|nr:hydantoinase B/oxoprolinase family protein [Candidatus Thiosymbion ectosymbiont of Robbea hypermnestra]